MKDQRQKGAVAIEFAFILPALVLLLFGIVEISLLMFNKQILTNASREGARYGIVGETTGNIEAKVRDYCAGHLISFGSGSTQVNPTAAVSNGYLEVTATYPFNFLVLDNFGLGPVTLRAKTVMKLE